MKKLSRLTVFLAMPLILAAQVTKQEEPGITRQQADEILNELRQIRYLLERQAQQAPPAPAPPATAKLNLQGTPMLGSKDAPLTMVEFTDYQCPFCQQFHVKTFPDLKKNFIDTGKVRFYSRDLPLDALHPNAIRAAQAARCADEQGQFWKLRDIMSAHPDKLDMENLMADAEDLKMDGKAFRGCVESGKYKDVVESDVMEAMRVGADGTPSFVIGKSTPQGVDGELLAGARPFGDFVREISKMESAK
jgi:protein-disulfide isomerase